jgi:hypothetical protein
MKRALTGASRTRAPKYERNRAASTGRKPGSDRNIRRELDETLEDWNSGTALPKDDVAAPKTTKPPVTAERRPHSRTTRPASNVPPPSFSSREDTPKKTAWDPTNPGF